MLIKSTGMPLLSAHPQTRFDFLHSQHEWLQAVLSRGKLCRTLQTGIISGVRFCRRSWKNDCVVLRHGGTRAESAPCGETSGAVATQAQACQFRSFVGLFHGPGPHDHRVGHRARLRRINVSTERECVCGHLLCRFAMGETATLIGKKHPGNACSCSSREFPQGQQKKLPDSGAGHGKVLACSNDIGRTRADNALNGTAIWQTKKHRAVEKKSPHLVSMIIRSNKKNWKRWENCQKFDQIVLNCLFLARIRRPDILWSVSQLARAVTKWTRACD